MNERDNLKDLKPALPEEIEESLSFALRYSGRKRIHEADELMARITAGRLIEHLRTSGFVIMKEPPTTPVSIALHRRDPST